MASQPLNATISVFRRVRAQRWQARHDSIKNITDHLRALILVAPGEEINTAFGTRDTSVTDLSPYMGMGSPLATRGHPITIGVVTQKAFSLIENLTGIDFPVEIQRDKFIQDDAAHVGSDLHAAARALD